MESSKLKLLSFKGHYQESETSWAPTGCWQGALNPRWTRETPKHLCMMCGVSEGEEIFRLVGVSAPEGQLGKERFSHTWRGTHTSGDQWGWGGSLVVLGECTFCFCPPSPDSSSRSLLRPGATPLYSEAEGTLGTIQATLSIGPIPA